MLCPTNTFQNREFVFPPTGSSASTNNSTFGQRSYPSYHPQSASGLETGAIILSPVCFSYLNSEDIANLHSFNYLASVSAVTNPLFKGLQPHLVYVA